MNVSKYEVQKPVIIKGAIFEKGDIIYIQNYDPVNRGLPQQVFYNRNKIGNISGDHYFELLKYAIKECVDYPTKAINHNTVNP